LIDNDPLIIGEWIGDFNQEKTEGVESLLNTKLKWDDKDKLWFCISKKTILETSWGDFKKLWIEFLYCEDDCPIIINEKNPNCAIIFRPIGDIKIISSPSSVSI